MQRIFFLVLICCGASWMGAVQAGSYTISADLWMQPRNGAELAQMPPVRAAIQDWLHHPKSHLVILHSGDDVGSLWSSELQDWLVSLGVPSDRIEKRVSGQDENSITLAVEP